MIRNIRKFLVIISICIPLVAIAQNDSMESLTLLREDESLIHFYLERKSPADVSDVLLLILQGSECNSIFHKKAGRDKLRNVWPSADLLTVEKYGIDSDLSYSSEFTRTDCPEIYLQKDNLEQRVRDLIQVLSYIRQKYSYKNIVVLGGSEGATIAIMLTSEVDYIDATISFGVGGRTFMDDFIEGIQNSLEDQNEIQKRIDGFNQFAEYILSSEPSEEKLGEHGFSWWKSILQYDQQAILAEIESPVLLVQGGKDESASPTGATKMVNELRRTGRRNIDYFFYDELDHSLGIPNGESFSENAIADMNAWLKDKIEKSPNN